MDATHVLQQADGLGDRLRQRMVDLVTDVVDLAARFTADVARYEVVESTNDAVTAREA
jgi:hypothetical protein